MSKSMPYKLDVKCQDGMYAIADLGKPFLDLPLLPWPWENAG